MHYVSYLADIFIQVNLQLIRLSGGQSPLKQCGVKGFAEIDCIMATPGVPPTFRVPVMYLSHEATGWEKKKIWMTSINNLIYVTLNMQCHVKAFPPFLISIFIFATLNCAHNSWKSSIFLLIIHMLQY